MSDATLCRKGLHPMVFPNVRAIPGRKPQCRACAAHHKRVNKPKTTDEGGWRSRGWIRSSKQSAAKRKPE